MKTSIIGDKFDGATLMVCPFHPFLRVLWNVGVVTQRDIHMRCACREPMSRRAPYRDRDSCDMGIALPCTPAHKVEALGCGRRSADELVVASLGVRHAFGAERRPALAVSSPRTASTKASSTAIAECRRLRPVPRRWRSSRSRRRRHIEEVLRAAADVGSGCFFWRWALRDAVPEEGLR